jgi:hypothetical protein
VGLKKGVPCKRRARLATGAAKTKENTGMENFSDGKKTKVDGG